MSKGKSTAHWSLILGKRDAARYRRGIQSCSSCIRRFVTRSHLVRCVENRVCAQIARAGDAPRSSQAAVG